MSKFIAKMPAGGQVATSDARPVTHCLIGKRLDEFERPSEEILAKVGGTGRIAPDQKMTDDEREIVRLHAWAKASGKYAMQPLTWVCSEEEGGQAKLLFKEPEWDQESFQLIPVRELKYER